MRKRDLIGIIAAGGLTLLCARNIGNLTAPTAPTVTLQRSYSAPVAVYSPPRVIKQEPVVYPNDAREFGIEGKVIVEADINRYGDVTYAKVLVSSGSDMLHQEMDYSALDAVYQYKFGFADTTKVPEMTKVRIPIEYKLR